MSKIMADENNEEIQQESQVDKPESGESSTSQDGEGGADTGKEPEPQVPLSRLRQKDDTIKELKQQLQTIQGDSSKGEISDDEKRIRDIIEKREKEVLEDTKQSEKQRAEQIDKLHEVHGEFNDTKFLDFVEDNPIRDDEGSIDYIKSMKIFQKLGGDGAPKPKPVKGTRTGDVPKKESYDVAGKSMQDIAEESKKELS